MGCSFSRLIFCVVALLPPAALMSCGDQSSPEAAAPGAAHQLGPYFNLRGLLDRQVQDLAARRPAVEKEVTMRGSQPETVRVPQVKWADELQVFYQADINKAALRGVYTVDSAAVPGGTRRTYRLKPGHDTAPVVRLDVLTQAGQPQEVHATLRQDNALFFGQKRLRLTFRSGQLAGYEVGGVQKLVLFDTLRYRATARVL